MKKFLTVFFAGLTTFGCSACTPDIESPEKEPDEVVVVDTVDPGPIDTGKDRSWVTWTDCGGGVGDHACDFTFKDQHDADWPLYDQRGKLTLLDFSTMWCSVCNNIATKGDEFESMYADQPFQWITVLVDDSAGGEVGASDVQAWVSAYSISSTVLAGDRSIIDASAADGFPITSWPTLVLVGEEMEILAGWHGWNESWVTTAIEDNLN